jgi:hypothetical protein
MENNQPKDTFFKSLLYAILLAVVYFILKTDRNETIPLVAWVSDSSKPELGFIFLSLLLTNILWLLLSYGLLSELSIGIITFGKISQKSSRIEIIIITGLSLFSLIYLLMIPPACGIPIISFEVNSGGKVSSFTPEGNVYVEDAGSVLVDVQSEIPAHEMDCELYAMGEIVESYNQNTSSCSAVIFLNNNNGAMVVSALVKKKYCENTSLYNLTIIKQ